jgi:hypothetical protein
LECKGTKKIWIDQIFFIFFIFHFFFVSLQIAKVYYTNLQLTLHKTINRKSKIVNLK